MTAAEIERKILAALEDGEPHEYAEMLTSVPEAGPDKTAAALWRLRNRKQVVFRLTARAGQKPLHTVEIA